ncbi:hypothetical protein [Synechococcus elongatus]|uniref:Uncharacterized protein n=3 Tax=Synechococcus elongatus TaxID=32046 RepID=Q31S63_SYNE7|nr:hypothetical protein [Synechococcus elongatus]UOW75297.1 hypothetical protein PCC6301pg_0075 [Synechococcus elongatus PCC 6301]ABB56106.1 conserved hypothetical protein [Synechococcus elongatus PCC 7942 = FACHB-805]MBD2587937.1 hypothetical protein [Synechococcus elongatus FACHB-242]MBD2707355.1 hypothetical protein [Synechococcus elongatus PCC 7942 = FACHB-805]UOW69855.1 hypothetical protein PCC7943_0075 [Synechococcus elongatus PCC 7943]
MMHPIALLVRNPCSDPLTPPNRPMLQIHLRSLNYGTVVISTQATATQAAPLELTGHTPARKVLQTLLRLIFPQLQARSSELKMICTNNPLFQYWFQVEAIIEAGSGMTRTEVPCLSR